MSGLIWGAAAFLVNLFAGRITAAYCGENLQPGEARTEFCEAMDPAGYVTLIFGPPLIVIVVAIASRHRSKSPSGVAGAAAIGFGLIWIAALAVAAGS